MMKVTMKANLLQYLFKSKNTQCFTSPAMLVRIFIYGGIFVNLLLPFYNYQTNSFGWWDDSSENDAYSEAQVYMGAMIRAQHDSYLEHGKFSDSLEELQIAINTETKKYNYRILSQMVPILTLDESGQSAADSESVVMVAQAKYSHLTSYIGMVSLIKDENTHKVRPISAVCQIDSNTPLPSLMPTLADRDIQCPKGSKKVREMIPQTSFHPPFDHQPRT